MKIVVQATGEWSGYDISAASSVAYYADESAAVACIDCSGHDVHYRDYKGATAAVGRARGRTVGMVMSDRLPVAVGYMMAIMQVGEGRTIFRTIANGQVHAMCDTVLLMVWHVLDSSVPIGTPTSCRSERCSASIGSLRRS